MSSQHNFPKIPYRWHWISLDISYDVAATSVAMTAPFAKKQDWMMCIDIFVNLGIYVLNVICVYVYVCKGLCM